MPNLPADQSFDPVWLRYAGTHIEAGPEIYRAKQLTRMSTSDHRRMRVPQLMDMSEGDYDELLARCSAAIQDDTRLNMSTLRVPLPPSMLEDQPFNEVRIDRGPKPDNVGLQDGMLDYYRSQIPLTDGHEDGRLAREYFDCRDMLGTEKK